jgi:ankyrin repeat protein
MSVSADSAFDSALGHLLSGDLGSLAGALSAAPELVHARASRSGRPYDGYFHRATLLHHAPGNPLLRPLPASIVEGARPLLEAGAEVDAVTEQGPSQPDDIGWTPLGLAASSGEARNAGVQIPLMELLLRWGADPDARGGGVMMGALYYGQGEAARYLAGAGATLDVVAAAGVGARERLEDFLDLPAEELAVRPRLVHYARAAWPRDLPPGEQAAHLRGLALVYAALHGQEDCVRLLLEAGVDPDHRPPFEHGATPLHWAVMGDQPAAVRILLAAGADPGARDREFDSTPAGWAEYLGRPRAAEALRG